MNSSQNAWSWLLLIFNTHSIHVSAQEERLHSLLCIEFIWCLKSIAALLFAFHDYIKNVPTTFAKDFNSCSLAYSKTHFSAWALKASHSSQRKSKHNGHDGKNKRVVSSLEWMLNAGRRAKCQTCRAVVSSPIYIKLKSSQSTKIGQIFLVNDNLLPGEAKTAQLQLFSARLLYISFCLDNKIQGVAFQVIYFQFSSKNIHFHLFIFHADLSQSLHTRSCLVTRTIDTYDFLSHIFHSIVESECWTTFTVSAVSEFIDSPTSLDAAVSNCGLGCLTRYPQAQL